MARERDPEMRLPPVLFDPRPRVIEPTVPMDLAASALEHCWDLLKPMTEMRGFKDVALCHCELWASSVYGERAIRLAQEHNLSLIVVPAELMKTHYAWALRYNQDSVLSAPVS